MQWRRAHDLTRPTGDRISVPAPPRPIEDPDMIAFGLDEAQLRTLNQATGGGLYAALARCKDEGLEPHLLANVTPAGEATGKRYDLVFLARDAEGTSVFADLWRVGEDAGEAYAIAKHLSLYDTMAAMQAGGARTPGAKAN
jgi:hypothetical protein